MPEKKGNPREPARRFQDLLVRQKAHRFVLNVYRLTQTSPSHELYGLATQLRRAAVSTASNIAEGFKKKGATDKARFMNIAQASLEESRYYLILAADLPYADTTGLQTSQMKSAACWTPTPAPFFLPASDSASCLLSSVSCLLFLTSSPSSATLLSLCLDIDATPTRSTTTASPADTSRSTTTSIGSGMMR